MAYVKHTYALGAVKPHVRAAADEVGNLFDITTIYGYGVRANASDHPKGLALDFMVDKDKSKGDAVYQYLAANHARLGLTYVIWWQAIDNFDGRGLVPMADRGGTTANHKDHNHASFNATGGDGSPAVSVSSSNGSYSLSGSDVVNAIPGVSETAQLLEAFAFLTDPKNWWRLFLFLTGGILLLLVLYRFIVSTALPTTIRKVVTSGRR